MFDLERGDEEEEDSGHRSILGLEQIEFAPERKARPSISSTSESVLGTDGAAPIGEAPGSDAEEESGRRSILGLEHINRSAHWRAAVAASPVKDRFAGRAVAPPRKPAASEAEEDSGHPFLFGLERSEFGLGRQPSAATDTPGKPGPDRPPTSAARSESSRARLEQRDLLALRTPSPAQIDPPHFERDLEVYTVQPIPVERAILLSLVAHVVLFLLLLWAPLGATGPARGLLAQLIPPEKPEDKIPIVFRSAPGPERENPKKSDLSDKTRRAGGGDKLRPRADTPFIPQRPGVEGLAPGAGKMARAAPPPPQPAAGEVNAKAGASGERAKTAEEGFRVPPPGSASGGSEGPRVADLQRAIRDAAREVGTQGLGGAGTSNPEGGFVDSGPISFDTSWYDWGAYAEEMVRRIKLHWEIPELARLGWKGRLTVRFFILADGRVEGAKYISHSGIPPFDFAALNAILKSDPFRPLPRDLLAQVPGKDREGITVTFFYNIRPERE